MNLEGNLLATTGETGKIKLWRIDSFKQLMSQVCSLMENYLQNNPTVDSSDRTLCNDIPYILVKSPEQAEFCSQA